MEIPSQPQASSEPVKRFPQLDNKELIKSSFWISQVFMIIATVTGVFLAAQEGLSQAITFDTLTNKQNNYYLRHALYDEVSDNVQELNEYRENIVGKSTSSIKNFHPNMATFVWENMRYSQYTLETPSAILSEIRRFYIQAEDIVNKIENRVYGAQYGGDLLEALTEKISTKTLPALKANYTELAEELKRNDIIVE
ncbi:hypothetical protein [Shewanella woodyi]|uniref:hypothetical protein n=1 Tax=Shewanella woodyi TaxID=60961 RepID=UPI003747F616